MIGKTTRAHASAYDRTRVHSSRLQAGERRCLVANFNGALPVGRSIVRADWELDSSGSVGIADGSIEPRCATVMLTAGKGGTSAIRCTVTLDSGDVYVQLFHVEVLGSPWGQSVTSSTRITVTA